MMNRRFIILMVLLMAYSMQGRALGKENVALVDVEQLLTKVGDPFEEKVPQEQVVLSPKAEAPVAAIAAPIQLPVVQQLDVVQSVRVPVAPTVSTASVPVEKPNFTINGIIWSGTIHEAVINGQAMTLGDRIGDALIVDINREGVTVDVKGTKFTIPVQ